MKLNWQNILAIASVLVVFASMVTMEVFSYTDKTYDKIEELHKQLLLKISNLRVLLTLKQHDINEEDKPATIVPEDMCEEKKEEHPLEDCILYLYMREKQREEEEKKQAEYVKAVITSTSTMPDPKVERLKKNAEIYEKPMTIHLNAGHYPPVGIMPYRNEKGELVSNVKSYTNGDAIMDIFCNSGMDIRPNSCPNCTHEIESKDAIFCSHCGKRLRKG